MCRTGDRRMGCSMAGKGGTGCGCGVLRGKALAGAPHFDGALFDAHRQHACVYDYKCIPHT